MTGDAQQRWEQADAPAGGNAAPAHPWPPQIVAAVTERVQHMLQHERLIWEERKGRQRQGKNLVSSKGAGNVR